MYLHAFTDGSFLANYAYYIVETEERFNRVHERVLTSTEVELLALLALLKSDTVIRASGMTVFSDSEAAVFAARRPAMHFKDLDGPLEKRRLEIQEALFNLPYKPRFVLIEDSFNLAHRVANNKRITLETGSKLPYKIKEGSRRWKRLNKA